MAKSVRKGKLRDDTSRIVAEIHGVSPRYVTMIRNGDRENEDIMATLVDYAVGKSQLIKTLENMVKLNPKPEKYGR